ncbi:GNAT family N-acetyltransferase [Saccharibacillus brassicae]|uniref:GNAT family N-acetyltransferase n=1 Tax=Saccharibacillus brassicae TaxID=2583377 RepID=A0A4Y6UZA0_SACBS|nr:GNAT family N-acetyltransferase [Saccharibacillus brassicae]QDH21858.1 GNAT family N-acetyltransferase [Saccharibacillus brassicae]
MEKQPLVIRSLAADELPPTDLLLLADPSLPIVEDYLRRGTCFVGTVQEKTVGAFVLLPTRPETVEIANVAVDERLHGQGFGRQLVLHAIRAARQARYKTIEIGTGNSSIGQLALYQKCGFRIVGVDPDFFIRHYEKEIYENGLLCRDMIRLSLNL